MSAGSEQRKRRAFDKWKIANPWLRLTAQFIDQTLVLIAILLILTVLYKEKSWTPQWLLLVAVLWPMSTFIYQCLMIYLTHTTLGKKAFALHVESANPKAALSPWQILTRQSLWWLGALSLGAGWSTILTRSDRRAWHDIASETLVVDMEKGQAPEPSGFAEKTLGRVWSSGISMVFFCTLSFLIFFQFQKLERSHFTNLVSLEDAAWLVLVDQFDPQFVRTNSVNEEKMASQLRLFVQAKNLPSEKKFNFYKMRMQANENFLCHAKDSELSYCQTSLLLGALLSQSVADATKFSRALVAIQLLARSESAGRDFQSKMDVFERALNNLNPNTIPYMAVKTHLIRRYNQRGQFQKAFDLVSSEKTQDIQINALSLIIQDQLSDASCQGAAFYQCDTSSISYCAQNLFWKNWNEGCAQSGDDYPKLTSNAAKLAWAWKRNRVATLSRTQWEVFKKSIVPAAGFETHILGAMDFFLSSREDKPVSLLEKSRALDTENPLWGWAQIPVIQRYGGQWLSLISESEQTRAEALGLKISPLPTFDGADSRGIASEPKAK